MAGFLDLPRELLHHVLVDVGPADLAALSRTCKELHAYVRDDVLLWKLVYLSHFDEPRRGQDAPGWSWPDELKRLTHAQKLLETSDVEAKLDSSDLISETIIDLLSDAVGPSDESMNIRFLSDHFKKGPHGKTNIDTLLCGSTLFTKSKAPHQRTRATESQRQLSAKLHALYGVPVGPELEPPRCSFALTVENNSLIISPAPMGSCSSTDRQEDEDGNETLPTHHYARAKVYDLRNYNTETFWGPFMPDRSHRVDWEKMEAIMVDLVYNMRKLHHRSDGVIGPWWGFEKGWFGASQDSYVSKRGLSEDMADEWDDLMTHSIPREVLEQCPREKDPYGVTGTWMRVVCFLDYTDFYGYNFGIPHAARRSMDIEPLNLDEATRLISLELCATQIEAPGPDDGQDLPVVHYVGTSRSMHAVWDSNAQSKVKGTVRLTPEGEVHWTSFSIFDNNEVRWRSEGIQVGGPRSGRGILGTWFDKDYDPRGPAGPTAFWKVSDEVAGLDVDSDASSSA